MNINVTTAKVSIDNESLNKGEYNVRECDFDLAEEYEGLVCKALFTVIKTKLTYEQSIVNGKCNIPYEATVNRGKVIVGVVGYEVSGEELVKRYSPEPDEFFVLDGSYVEDIENQSTPTPTEIEQLEQRLSQVEIDAGQVEINTQDISNIKQEQTTQNNDILLRSLITETGSQIELSLNSSNFKMTATLKDKNGNIVNTSNEIDLPLESVVVNASYDSTTKEIVLTLQNGNTTRFSVADLVSGLISDTDYATSSKGGVVIASPSWGTKVTSGYLLGNTFNYSQYSSANESIFIDKGTLENVITGKELVNETQLDASQATQDTAIQTLQTDLANKADKSALVTGTGTEVTLQNTAELEFIQPPLPRGNSEQVQTTGANLQKFNVREVTAYNYKCDNKGQVTITGNITSYVSLGYNLSSNPITLLAGTYKLKVIGTISSNTSILLNNITGITLDSNQEYTYILNNDTDSFYIALGVNTGSHNDNFYITLTKGTTATTERYTNGASPNPSYPQAITNVTGDVEVLVQNKNFLPTNVENWEQGTLTNGINASSTTRIRTVDYWRIDNDINYHISIQNTNYCFLNINLYDKNKNYIGQYFEINQQINGTVNLTINIPSSQIANVYYMRAIIRKADNTSIIASEIETIKPMIELGTTATTFTPHKEQTFLFPLGTQRMYLGDYLADDGIHHVRKQETYNGSENWNREIGNNGRYNLLKDNAVFGSATNNPIICSHFQSRFATTNYSIFLSGAQHMISIIYQDIEFDVNTWKTWLSENPITVEYELTTEEITPYTTEQQTVYNEIKQAISYEEQTNISGSSDESNPIFEVQAVEYKEPDYWTIAYVNTQIGNAIGGAY